MCTVWSLSVCVMIACLLHSVYCLILRCLVFCIFAFSTSKRAHSAVWCVAKLMSLVCRLMPHSATDVSLHCFGSICLPNNYDRLFITHDRGGFCSAQTRQRRAEWNRPNCIRDSRFDKSSFYSPFVNARSICLVRATRLRTSPRKILQWIRALQAKMIITHNACELTPSPGQ